MNLDELAKKYGGSPVQSGSSRFDELAQKYGGAEVQPAAAQKEESGFLRQVADVPLSIGRGAATGVRMIADAFGAGSEASEAIKGVEGYLSSLMSAQAKNDEQEVARIMKDAEDKGVLDQVKAGFKAFSVAPIDLLSQGLGTAAAPVIGMLGGKLLGAGALGMSAIGTGIGAGMGAGSAKGGIYEEVKAALKEANVDEAKAEQVAIQAQEYGGKNMDQILLSAGLGGLAGRFGLESSAKRMLTGAVGKEAGKGAVREMAEGATRTAVTESVPELLQGSQEQVAKNIALQREGFDVPTMRGVAGSGTLEALAGAGLGAVTGGTEAGLRRQARGEADRILAEEEKARADAEQARLDAEAPPVVQEPPVESLTAEPAAAGVALPDDVLAEPEPPQAEIISEPAPEPAPEIISEPAPEPSEKQVSEPTIPPTDNYATLKQEQQRLKQQKQTPETKKLIGRIEERLDAIVMRDIENRRSDKEKSVGSVFAQEELPPVERRGAVVAERDLTELQAKEGSPELTDFELQQAKKTARMAGRPSDESTEFLSKQQQMQKDMKALEAKRNKIKTGGNLYKTLEGQLDPSEVSDIAPDIKKLYGKGYRPLANPAGQGTFISELVEDGLLNDYLPSAMRPDSESFDAQASAEFLKRKLRTKNTKSEVSNEDTTEIDTQIEQLQRSMDEFGKPEISVAEVEPGEAASIERSATEQDVGEATDIRYQRSTTGGKSIGKQQTQSVVDAVKGQWANAPEVVVAESMDDPAIPEAVRTHNTEAVAKGAKGSPKGFFYKGKAYILADSIKSSRDAMETLFHESLGHYGLRGTFGPEMGKVLADVVKNRRADVEAKAKQYGLDVNNDKDMLEAAEEVLAEMAQTKPGLSFVKRAIAVIRNFLRDLGLPFKMSDADLIQKYILPARAFVEKGASKRVEGTPAAMREEASAEDVRYQRDSITGKPILAQWTTPNDTKIAGDIGKDDIIYSLQNKMIDTKRVVDAITATAGKIAAKWNPYLQEELYHGRTAKQTKDFLTEELRPLMQAMEKSGVNIADMEEYLKNRHAIAYNAQVAKVNPGMPDKGSGIATADAQAYLNSLSPSDKAKYEALAKRVDEITKGTRKLLVDSGLETQETIDNWEKTFPFYVPLKRGDIDYAYTAGGMGTGQGFDVRGDFSRRAMGSEREATDVLANIAMMRERAIVKAQKNRVAQALFGLAAQNPNPQFWLPVDPMAEVDPANMQELLNFGLSQQDLDFIAKEPRQKAIDKKRNEVVERINATLRGNENVLSMRFNGQDRYVFFNPNDPRSERMAKSMKNLDADQLGSILGGISTVTRWMAAVNTQYNPIFGAYNFLRDVQGAALQLSDTPLAKDKKAVVGGTLPALKGIYAAMRAERGGSQAAGPWAALWEEFQQEGGQTGFRDQFSRSQERAEALQKELNKITEGKAKAAGRAVLDWLSDYNDSMENAVRLSAYKAALDKGIDKQEAASIAKNLTVNFNRKGQIGVQAGALYAFFNAAVQGTTRLAQTIKGPAGKKIIAGGLLLGTMQAALLAAAGFDEEEPPEFVRERNLIIPIGGDKYLAFPMPLGYHVIPGTSRILTEWALSGFKDTPERIASLTGMFLDAFNPIGNAGWSAQTLAPTFADPIVALTENKDWTGKPIARKDFDSRDPTPGYTRSKEATNIVFKKIAEYLNLASGGTDFQPGIFSPTPDQLEYLWGQATGGLGREIAKGITTVEKTITGEDLPSYKIPLAGRFYGETKSSAAESGRFYKNMEKLNKHENEIKGRRDKKQPLGDYLKDNPEARLAPMARKVYNDVRELRKRREALMERDAPKESVQAVEKMITRKMQVLNDRVRALEESN